MNNIQRRYGISEDSVVDILVSTKIRTAPVSKIIPFSCVDGPGSRLVVFFQGCNMDCGNCHNPQTIGMCNNCSDCITHCPHDALFMLADKRGCNTDLCEQCDGCLDHCSQGGNPTSQDYTVDQLIKLVMSKSMLLDGITFSGGEATLHRHFITEFCQKLSLQSSPLNVVIDSNGLLACRHWPALTEYSDGVMLDIKAIDPVLHKEITSRDNQQVLASAQWLASEKKLVQLRWLIIAGLNDTESEIKAMIAFYLSLSSPPPLQLNQYRHHGVREYFSQQYAETSYQDICLVAERLQAAGIEVVLPLDIS